MKQLQFWPMGDFYLYSQFSTASEFADHLQAWISERTVCFTREEKICFLVLIQYAADIPGICHQPISKMVQPIIEKYVTAKINESIFEGMINKLAVLGILDIYETFNHDGTQGSNLYVFNRYTTQVGEKRPSFYY